MDRWRGGDLFVGPMSDPRRCLTGASVGNGVFRGASYLGWNLRKTRYSAGPDDAVSQVRRPWRSYVGTCWTRLRCCSSALGTASIRRTFSAGVRIFSTTARRCMTCVHGRGATAPRKTQRARRASRGGCILGQGYSFSSGRVIPYSRSSVSIDRSIVNGNCFSLALRTSWARRPAANASLSALDHS